MYTETTLNIQMLQGHQAGAILITSSQSNVFVCLFLLHPSQLLFKLCRDTFPSSRVEPVLST